MLLTFSQKSSFLTFNSSFFPSPLFSLLFTVLINTPMSQSNNFRSFISVSLLRGVGEYFWVHTSAHKIWIEVKSCFLGRVKYSQFKEFSSSFLPPTAWIPGTKYLPAYSNHSNHNFTRTLYPQSYMAKMIGSSTGVSFILCCLCI